MGKPIATKPQSANTFGAQKPKRKAPPTAWKPGQSGNPKGSPKRGESWAEVVTRVFNMTGAEVADYAMPLAKQLRTIGDTVTLKEAVTLRVAVALMNEPTPGLFNAVMDRVEGTPKQTLGVEGAKGGAIETVLRVVYDDPKPRSTPADATPKAK